jgi:hypothetical protein
MYAAITALLLLVVSSTFVLEHGGAENAKPGSVPNDSADPDVTDVSLHDLTSVGNIERYGGHLVRTSGTLYFNSASNNFVITTGNENFPVVLRSSSKLAQYEGRNVIVTGVFDLVPGAGPSIEVRFIAPGQLDSPSPEGI